MSRWGVRIAGLIFVLVLLVLLFRLQSRLAEMQRARTARPAAADTAATDTATTDTTSTAPR